MDLLDRILEAPNKNSTNVFTSKIVFRKKEYLDENIFFTALIAYLLKSLKQTFSADDQIKIETIIQNSLHAFSFYQNKHGGSTYNFYQTKPVNQYSGIPFLNKFQALQIPDDLDSTSLIYLTSPKKDHKTFLSIKSKLESLSYDGKPLKSLPKKYGATKAYRTWFATKMNHDMDICVICNVLTLMYENNVKMSEVDLESINFITHIVSEKKHLKQTYLFSPHYKNKTIVLYHITRLISVSNHPSLTSLKPQVSLEIKETLLEKLHPIEKIILNTSLYRIKENSPFHIQVKENDFDTFYWFYANPFSVSSPLIKAVFSRKLFLHLQYKCKTHNIALLLELKQVSNASISYTNNIISLYNT